MIILINLNWKTVNRRLMIDHFLSTSCVDGGTLSEGRKSSRLLRWLEAGNCTDLWLGFYTVIDF